MLVMSTYSGYHTLSESLKTCNTLAMPWRIVWTPRTNCNSQNDDTSQQRIIARRRWSLTLYRQGTNIRSEQVRSQTPGTYPLQVEGIRNFLLDQYLT